MPVADARVGPQQESLGIRDDGMDPREGFGGLVGRHRRAIMHVMEGRQWVVDRKAVRANGLAGLDFLRNHVMDAVAIHPREDPHGHQSRSLLPLGLHHHPHRGLIGRAASPLAGADAAEKSVVHLDPAA